MVVNWKAFESNYLIFTEGVPKRLVVTKWEQVESKFKHDDGSAKPALDLEIVEEDGVGCTPVKSWEVTNFKAINLLRPIIEDAEKSGKGVVALIVTRMGKGTATQFAIVKAPLLS